MPEPWADEQQMIGYLLGALSETEAEHFDQQSLADDDFVARLDMVETDLVDAYVRGELTGDTLARFNRHYLASSLRREKVNLARKVVALVDAAAVRQTSGQSLPRPAKSKKKAASSPFRLTTSKVSPAAWQWGLAAAALLMLLVSGYFLYENRQLSNRISQTQAERAALQQREQELQKQLDERHAADAETAKELARVRDRLAQLAAATNRQTDKPEPSNPALRVASFTLAPPLRGTSQVADITLPAGIDVVDLRLQLDANDFPAYQTALKDPATGQVIWRSGRLRADRQGKAVSVRLRAGSLKPQNYSLELTGIRVSGEAEIIGSYPFKVAIQ